MKRKFIGILLIALAALVMLPAVGRAETYGFSRTSFNSAYDVGAQLIVEVEDEGSGQVSFKFLNDVDSGEAASITDVYFYDGDYIVTPPTAQDQTSGVSFAPPASPGDHPLLKKTLTLQYSSDSDAPVSSNGIDATGEYLKLTFDLDQYTFAQLNEAIETGEFAIALHIQALPDGESDWYVVPLPGAALLGLLGLGAAGIKLRKLV